MRKGFTLVELAIVLVIIGLIMGMTIKGKELIRTAQIKADAIKIDKMRTAMYIVNARRNGKLPDIVDKNNPALVNESVDKQALFNAGILKPSDMYSNMVNQSWAISRCATSPKQPHNCTYEQYSLKRAGCNTPMIEGLCAGLASPVGSDGYAAGHEPSLYCYYESILDDESFTGGDGKYLSHRPNKPVFTQEQMQNCDSLPTPRVQWSFKLI